MKHRLFIAITVPPALHPDITKLQTTLSSIGPDITWEPSEKLHLTLNFIGRTDQDMVSQLIRLLQKELAGLPAFSITPAFLETLYRRHELSLVYLGIGGDVEALKQLQKTLGATLSTLTLPQQTRFLPHILIGRLPKSDPVTIKRLLGQVDDLEIQPLPKFTVNKITLFESLLSKSGSTYQKLVEFALMP